MTTGSFTSPRAAARDDVLPFDTRGFLWWLSSHTARFVAGLNEARIRELTGLGRDHVRRMLRELTDAGYLIRTRLHDVRGQLLAGVRYALNMRPDRQQSLPVEAPMDAQAVHRSEQAKHDVSAGGAMDGLGVHRSIYREEQEENKELPAPPRAAPQSHGGPMPRTRKQTPGQTALWPSAAPEPTRELTHAGTDVQRVDNAGVIVGEWLQRCPVRPPSRVIGQVSKLVKEMVAEGIDGDLIRRGIASWMGKGLHPATLPAEVNAVANRHAAARPSTTDDRVAATLALAARMAQQDRTPLRAVSA